MDYFLHSSKWEFDMLFVCLRTEYLVFLLVFYTGRSADGSCWFAAASQVSIGAQWQRLIIGNGIKMEGMITGLMGSWFLEILGNLRLKRPSSLAFLPLQQSQRPNNYLFQVMPYFHCKTWNRVGRSPDYSKANPRSEKARKKPKVWKQWIFCFTTHCFIVVLNNDHLHCCVRSNVFTYYRIAMEETLFLLMLSWNLCLQLFMLLAPTRLEKSNLTWFQDKKKTEPKFPKKPKLNQEAKLNFWSQT